MKYLLTLVTAGLVANLLLTAPLPAADFPGSETADVVYEYGKIDQVSEKDSYVIVNDSRYLLAPNVKVYSASGTSAALSSLKRGTRVAFAVEGRSGDSARTITELKIRPVK